MSNQPFDIRSTFFKQMFEMALPYAEYIKTANPTQLERWNSFDRALALNDQQKKLVETFSRSMPVLAVSGIWCGDCMRQGPMLHRIAEYSALIDLRFIDNQTHPELRDELRIAGGARVPVVIAMSEDFFEVSRFGDRTLSHYRAKAARELGSACDSGLLSGDVSELEAELAEWLQFFERAQLILRVSPFLRTRHQD